MHIVLEQQKQSLCTPSKQRMSSTISISLFSGLTLEQYAHTHKVHCITNHFQPCQNCCGMNVIAQEVLVNGYPILSQVYHKAFPNKVYKADIAKRHVLQMPLVAI